jgi:type IV fimbrial biogenesis protein FimT
MKNAYTLQRNRGFTMIELLVTITIATVLSVAAVPSFRNQMVGSRLVTQSNEMVSAINFARSEAIKRNGSVTLCRVDSNAATACSTSAGVWQFWIVRTASGTIARRGVVNSFGGTVIVRSTLATDTAIFGADGLTRTGSGLVNSHQISVCATNGPSSTNTKSVVLGASSRISTQTLSAVCS